MLRPPILHAPDRPGAFTLIELLVIISIIALLIGILLPALAAARQASRQMQSNTQLRGVHQGMVIFAQGNKTGTTEGQYPGLAPDGSFLPDIKDDLANIDPQPATDYSGHHPRARWALMLDQNLFSPEYAVNPLETDPAIYPYVHGNGETFFHFDSSRGVYGGGTNWNMNWSYAMPRLNSTSGTRPIRARGLEWAETLNGNALVLSDRILGPGDDDGGTGPDPSHHSYVTREGSGQWRGGLAWNDGHVETANTVRHDTQYGPHHSGTSGDPIFRDGGDTDQACMIHSTFAERTEMPQNCDWGSY